MSKASEHAYLEIRKRVLSGAFAPGQHLKEEELVGLLGVSRTPIRDALRRLEVESYLNRAESGRVYVPDWSSDDLEELFTLRAMLEGEAASRAALRANAADRAELSRLCAAIGEAVGVHRADAELNADAFLTHNRTFHRLIHKIAGSERLVDLIARIVEPPVVLRTALVYDKTDLLRSHHEHEALVAAITQKDAAWARATMVAHIQRAYHVYRATKEARAHLDLVSSEPNKQPSDKSALEQAAE
jgi:DNA-binding GntR family transcriptional regulator